LYEPVSQHADANGLNSPAPSARPLDTPVANPPVAALFVLASLILFVACWLWPHPGNFWGPTFSCTLAWMFFVIHVVAARREITAFDPALWVPVLMLLHYFGMPVAIKLLGYESIYGYDAWELGHLPRIGQGFATALLVLVAFLAGLHFVGFAPLQRDPDPPAADERSTLAAGMTLFLGGLAMLLVGIPIAGASLVFGDYQEMKTAEKFATADLRFVGTGYLFAVAGVYAVFANYRRESPWPTRLALAGCGPIIFFLLLIGDRTGLSSFIMCGGWAFTQRVRKVPRWVAIIGFAFALIVMPVIKEFRHEKGVSESTRLSVVQLVGATFMEMGSTLQVYCYTLDSIPREKRYDWGLSIPSQLMGLIPNFGLTSGRRFLVSSGVEHKPSRWVTKTASPEKYENNLGGYAYAIGAEWYFNFGMPGVLFGMFLTGFAVAKIRNACRRSPMWLTLSALFLSTMVLIVRNDFGYPARTALWPLTGLLVFRFMYGLLGIGRAPRRTAHPGVGLERRA